MDSSASIRPAFHQQRACSPHLNHSVCAGEMGYQKRERHRSAASSQVSDWLEALREATISDRHRPAGQMPGSRASRIFEVGLGGVEALKRLGNFLRAWPDRHCARPSHACERFPPHFEFERRASSGCGARMQLPLVGLTAFRCPAPPVASRQSSVSDDWSSQKRADPGLELFATLVATVP
jgi:hypothetical protein